ncbi:MAG: Xaa-Pro peptidase family protein [Burkholderiaceae bacterium]
MKSEPTVLEVAKHLNVDMVAMPSPHVFSNGVSPFDSIAPDYDPVQLRAERLQRVRAMMAQHELDAVLLLDPYNQRYATGSRNMFGYFLRNSTRYIYIPRKGRVILFEYPGSSHISTWLETIDEARTSRLVFAAVNGRDTSVMRPFASEILDLLAQDAGKGHRVGMDRCFHMPAKALEDLGVTVIDILNFLLDVRRIKTPGELASLALSMAAAESAVWQVQKNLEPGLTENELFADMYRGLIAAGGEFIETRLLTSGPKTNPWFNETGDRRIRPGELLALDTDSIGCNGYYADFSRSFLCGEQRPTPYQKMLYRLAHDQIRYNEEMIKPGMSFREIAQKAWPVPGRFYDLRYPSIVHGVGLHGEKPIIAHLADLDRFTGDGILEPGMVISIESYIGENDGPEGVKLENQYAVSETSLLPMCKYPFEERMLAG